MAASPPYKVHDRTGRYVAACKLPRDAAALVMLHGAGATVKLNGRIIYRSEGITLHRMDIDAIAAVGGDIKRGERAEALRRIGRYNGTPVLHGDHNVEGTA